MHIYIYKKKCYTLLKLQRMDVWTKFEEGRFRRACVINHIAHLTLVTLTQ